MLSYDRLSRNPRIFRSFSGLEVPGLDSVYEKVESKYDEFERIRLSRKPRKKGLAQAGGSSCHLGTGCSCCWYTIGDF